MKKKKLKKKIKQLKRQLDSLKTCHNNVAFKLSRLQELRENMEDTIDHLNELMADIENKPKDNRINILWEWMQRSGIDFHDWGETPTYAEEVVYTEDIQRQINEINDRLRILDRRTQTDYNKIAPESYGKTCDTCKWYPLMKQGGQDIPCMGCTANDKKMWKSKEA